ncbi:hypothetical protein GH733_006634 [Mirounga leonina]|nr:hypothetical protein GH733_006634 [Mirounga leonina]
MSTEVTLSVKKDIPPSAVTRPIFGILDTIHLVAAMINHVLNVDGFYFLTTYDLTHTFQQLSISGLYGTVIF